MAFSRPEFVDFFAESCSGAAEEGRRGVLQPGAVSRCRVQRSERSGGSPTCCRSRRRSAARWRRWIARDGRAVYPALLAMKEAGRPQRELLNAVVATAEGYAVPHQPRQRSADGQPGPAQSGRHRAGRVGRRPHRRPTRRRTARPRRSENAMTTLGARPHRPRCDEAGRRGEMASGLAADDRAGQREVVAAQHGLQVLQRLDPLASASAMHAIPRRAAGNLTSGNRRVPERPPRLGSPQETVSSRGIRGGVR